MIARVNIFEVTKCRMEITDRAYIYNGGESCINIIFASLIISLLYIFSIICTQPFLKSLSLAGKRTIKIEEKGRERQERKALSNEHLS